MSTQNKEKNYYEMLEIAKDASLEEIKKAYRKMAMRYHPDRHQGEDIKKSATMVFVAIAAAYEILKTPETRAKYDTKLRAQAAGIQDAQSTESSTRTNNYRTKQEQFRDFCDIFEFIYGSFKRGDIDAKVLHTTREENIREKIYNLDREDYIKDFYHEWIKKFKTYEAKYVKPHILNNRYR